MSEMMIKCPTCGVFNNESNWNDTTRDILNGLNMSLSYTPYVFKQEGTLFRCPNSECEDEVVTDKDGVLCKQDDEGNPIKPTEEQKNMGTEAYPFTYYSKEDGLKVGGSIFAPNGREGRVLTITSVKHTSGNEVVIKGMAELFKVV